MNPSGLGRKTCLSDVAIKFIRNFFGFSEIKLDLDAFLLIADTGIHGHTAKPHPCCRKSAKRLYPLLQELGILTKSLRAAISIKDLMT